MLQVQRRAISWSIISKINFILVFVISLIKDIQITIYNIKIWLKKIYVHKRWSIYYLHSKFLMVSKNAYIFTIWIGYAFKIKFIK